MSSVPPHKDACKTKLLNLLATKAYCFGDFTLSSGKKSKHYVNCKPVSLSGRGLSLLSVCMLDHVELDSSAVAGLTLGADPLVSGVSIVASQQDRDLDALIVRKQAKGYGTGAWLEGPLPDIGSVVTVLEDVVTTGGSSLQAVKQLRNAGYIVNRVVAIVDRQEGADLAMRENNIELISLYCVKELIDHAKTLRL